MDIKTIRELLDRMPARSDYEFRHFELEQQGAWHRQLRYALAQAEQLTDEQIEISAEINLLQHELKGVRDKVELDIRTRIAEGKINRLNRRLQDILLKLNQINEWLSGWSVDECRDAVTGFSSGEGDHWSEVLGRQLGIELLAQKQADINSLLRISLMPLADYKKSVVISNQFADFLKRTAEQAENGMQKAPPGAIPSSATVTSTESGPTAVQKVSETLDEDKDQVEDDSSKDRKKKKKKKK